METDLPKDRPTEQVSDEEWDMSVEDDVIRMAGEGGVATEIPHVRPGSEFTSSMRNLDQPDQLTQ